MNSSTAIMAQAHTNRFPCWLPWPPPHPPLHQPQPPPPTSFVQPSTTIATARHTPATATFATVVIITRYYKTMWPNDRFCGQRIWLAVSNWIIFLVESSSFFTLTSSMDTYLHTLRRRRCGSFSAILAYFRTTLKGQRSRSQQESNLGNLSKMA